MNVEPYDYSDDDYNKTLGWNIAWVVNGPIGVQRIVAETPDAAVDIYLWRMVHDV